LPGDLDHNDVVLAMKKLIEAGSIMFAVSLAVFGAEHLTEARSIMQGVPSWMPGRLFWAYFVGLALIAAAISIAVQRYVRLSATLLGIMFFLFVLLIHLPNLATNPKDRIVLAVVLRDTAFSGGAFALAAQGRKWMVTLGRIAIAIPVVVFAVEQFLHPEFVPVVPLQMSTPAWIPFAPYWGYLAGAVMLPAGAAMLVNRQCREAAAAVGALVIVLLGCIYLPILVRAKPADMIEAVNYFADTMLFGGTVLLLAGASASLTYSTPIGPSAS
jgi:uncharacterized membrane protein